MSEPKRELLRHIVATIAYRGGKTLRGAPESFADFAACEKTPVEIVAHIGDLLEWTLRMCRGQHEWSASTPQGWLHESQRFYDRLAELDAFLASDKPLEASLERLVQGPIADSLTHIGQLAMMRRMAGAPIGRESYYRAEVKPVIESRAGAAND